MSTPPKYKFADFTFAAAEETLRKNGERLAANPKTLRVLALLLENSGRIVKKEEFFERVWADAFVEDNNLTVAVAQIRKVLGETKDAKFIETVPKKGYRFAAAVELIYERQQQEEFGAPPVFLESENTENGARRNENFRSNPAENEIAKSSKPAHRSAVEEFFHYLYSRKVLAFAAFALVIFSIFAFRRQAIAPTKSQSLESIAVLPFSHENAAADELIFAEKLTRDLTRNLGRVTDARVAAYEAVAPFDSPDLDLRRIGEDLKVENFIVGKISGAGGASEELEIKINNWRAGEIVWEKRYALNRKNLAETQYRVARDIAEEFGGKKEVRNPAAAVNYEAYQSYLLARHHLGKATTKDYERAIENFTDAVAKNASFADAYSGLSTARVLEGQNLYAAKGLSASRESFPAAKRAAVRALEIDPNSDEALAALAFVNYRAEYDWRSAEANFKRAVEINPNNVAAHRWFGAFLHDSGRFEEGFVAQKNALALEPNSARILNEIAWGNYLARRFDEAVKYAERARAIDKTNAAALYNASEIYENKKDYRQAVALWSEAMTIEEANGKWIARLEESFQTDGYRGFVRAKTDWLENLVEKDYVYPTDLAKGYAALDRKDKAFEWLERAVEAGVPDVLSIKYAPAFDNLRDDARFQKIVEKMNFPR